MKYRNAKKHSPRSALQALAEGRSQEKSESARQQANRRGSRLQHESHFPLRRELRSWLGEGVDDIAAAADIDFDPRSAQPAHGFPETVPGQIGHSHFRRLVGGVRD